MMSSSTNTEVEMTVMNLFFSLILENYKKNQVVVLSPLHCLVKRQERFGSFTFLTDTHPGTCPMSLSLPRLATNKVYFVF